ncbi:hypothetical protein BO82DRAFT_124042 [Aspergillus uvarum CBS 121591]|uniref:Uncharacterized protein n=1 Tax=Aspergillus uvarum CBS 121591 TaxID=1448315 RepID=A0A319C7P7_9EURO|nr:hypothetical protein BO82DRAFT_124042 [Aspergillus uvarum CBS 121591]PYH79827.1 hypothetical protein BO82DRAFT_124042 [Aspergillus uvarum CBS 121591]
MVMSIADGEIDIDKTKVIDKSSPWMACFQQPSMHLTSPGPPRPPILPRPSMHLFYIHAYRYRLEKALPPAESTGQPPERADQPDRIKTTCSFLNSSCFSGILYRCRDVAHYGTRGRLCSQHSTYAPCMSTGTEDVRTLLSAVALDIRDP